MRIWKDVALEALRFKDFEARIRPIRNLRHASLVTLPASHVSENESSLCMITWLVFLDIFMVSVASDTLHLLFSDVSSVFPLNF